MIKNSIWKIALVLIVIASVMISATGVLAADSLSLSISADKSSAQPGDTVTYTYTITNNSTDNMTGLFLIDDKLGSITLPSTEILAGENITATGSYTFTASDLPGTFTNSANVTGTLPSGDNVTASASASVELIANTSAIQIVKSADKTSACPGDNITYSYEISNAGNTDLFNITLNDSKLGDITLSSTTLAAGEKMTATMVYTVVVDDLPDPLKNTATVTAYDESGEMITATSDEVTVELTQKHERDTKREILRNRHVLGKGIDHAPGLQKFFNFRSRAEEHAGKKDIKNNGKPKSK